MSCSRLALGLTAFRSKCFASICSRVTVQLCSLVGALGQQAEELLEVGQRERRLLADLDVGEVVVPDTLGRPAPGEEEQVGLDARARGSEDARGQADDAPEVAVVQQLALGLDEGGLVGAEEHAFVEHHAARARQDCSESMTCCRKSTCVAPVL